MSVTSPLKRNDDVVHRINMFTFITVMNGPRVETILSKSVDQQPENSYFFVEHSTYIILSLTSLYPKVHGPPVRSTVVVQTHEEECSTVVRFSF